MSSSLQPYELQHARLPCASASPRVCSNLCPLSRWWYLIISSSVAPSPLAFSVSQHHPSIPVFSSESALHIRWPKYWSFSFSISPSNEYAGLFLPTFWIMQEYWNTNYHTIALISHASKVMLKILQARLQQYVNCELPDIQAGFRKGRGTRDQIANIHWIIKKAREFQKTSIFALLTMPKPLTRWITINCRKNCGQFWKRWEYQTTWPAS